MHWKGHGLTPPVGPATVDKVEERNIRDTARIATVNTSTRWQGHPTTYIGTSAKGAVIGAKPKLHIIFFRWNSCLSVAIVCNTLGSFSNRTALPGKSTSIFFVPCVSSDRRCEVSDGMLLSPHSSNGIRCWTRFPQVTRCFFQPPLASSQLAQVLAALPVALSSSDSSLDASFCRGRA